MFYGFSSNRLSCRNSTIIAFLISTSICCLAKAQTINDGVYTLGQVEKGTEVFNEYYKDCHTVEINQTIFLTWNQQSLSSMYDTMPQDNAGSLPLDDYTQALAYLLSLMGYPTGEQALDPYDGSMRDITVEPLIDD